MTRRTHDPTTCPCSQGAAARWCPHCLAWGVEQIVPRLVVIAWRRLIKPADLAHAPRRGSTP